MELSATGSVNWQQKATGVTPGYLNGTIYSAAKTPSGNYACFGAAYTDQRSIAVIDGAGAGYCNGVSTTIPASAPDAYTVSATTPIIIPPNILAASVTNASTTLTLTTTNMCGTIGLDETSFVDSDLNVYPNPAANEITLNFGDASFNKAEISFYNMLGEKVSSLFVSGNLHTIDISTLSAGVYLMEVVVNGNRIVKRVVKN